MLPSLARRTWDGGRRIVGGMIGCQQHTEVGESESSAPSILGRFDPSSLDLPPEDAVQDTRTPPSTSSSRRLGPPTKDDAFWDSLLPSIAPAAPSTSLRTTSSVSSSQSTRASFSPSWTFNPKLDFDIPSPTPSTVSASPTQPPTKRRSRATAPGPSSPPSLSSPTEEAGRLETPTPTPPQSARTKRKTRELSVFVQNQLRQIANDDFVWPPLDKPPSDLPHPLSDPALSKEEEKFLRQARGDRLKELGTVVGDKRGGKALAELVRRQVYSHKTPPTARSHPWIDPLTITWLEQMAENESLWPPLGNSPPDFPPPYAGRLPSARLGRERTFLRMQRAFVLHKRESGQTESPTSLRDLREALKSQYLHYNELQRPQVSTFPSAFLDVPGRPTQTSSAPYTPSDDRLSDLTGPQDRPLPDPAQPSHELHGAEARSRPPLDLLTSTRFQQIAKNDSLWPPLDNSPPAFRPPHANRALSSKERSLLCLRRAIVLQEREGGLTEFPTSLADLKEALDLQRRQYRALKRSQVSTAPLATLAFPPPTQTSFNPATSLYDRLSDLAVPDRPSSSPAGPSREPSEPPRRAPTDFLAHKRRLRFLAANESLWIESDGLFADFFEIGGAEDSKADEALRGRLLAPGEGRLARERAYLCEARQRVLAGTTRWQKAGDTLVDPDQEVGEAGGSPGSSKAG